MQTSIRRVGAVSLLCIFVMVVVFGCFDGRDAEIAGKPPKSSIPFVQALDAAAISQPRIDSVIENSLILGNGNINGLLYSEEGSIVLRLTKNDVWDSRLDTSADPPLPTLARIKELAYGDWPDRGWVLPKAVTWEGRDSYSAHAYPCPRSCAMIVLSNQHKASTCPNISACLDIRRAVARVTDSPDGSSKTEIRALAQRNVFLIDSPRNAELIPIESSEIPASKSGETDGIRWLTQKIPGDLDWPGMSFAVAMASPQVDVKAVAIVTSREARNPLKSAIELARSTIEMETSGLVQRHEAEWNQFWSASGIDIQDSVLCSIWYQNLYFLRCVSRPGSISPGLFASLTREKPAWHGDYHTNYNIQQTFWSSFPTNHADLAEPYDRLISEYLPRARWLAKKLFSMSGAYYPHVMFAYEPPDPEKCKSRNGRQYVHHVWGFTIGVSGFSVQPLWWHYKYKPDRQFLKKVAYPAVRNVAVFYADFIDQCEGDEKVVLAPSVSPEHWGWTENFYRNRNCAFDIGMVRYTFKAAIEGATILGCDAGLVPRWKQALKRLPPYPTDKSEPPTVVDVQDAPVTNYNIAVPATPVFPCDQITWWSVPAEKQLFVRTIEQLRWNGNNSTIMLAVARARLSMPCTLEWVREELVARRRTNGVIALNRLQRRHRFSNLGHYTEQFAASMAISELLIQSVGDIIRVFPAWPKDKDASFRDLRTQGGFLVSAEQKAGRITTVEIISTFGGRLRLLSPWPAIQIRRSNGEVHKLKPDLRGVVELDTCPSEKLFFIPS